MHYCDHNIIDIIIALPLGPGVPIISDVSGQSTSTIRIRWKEPSQTNGIILSYQIEFGRDDTNHAKSTYPDDQMRYEVFEDLESNTAYKARIRAKTKKGFGNWSSYHSNSTFEHCMVH